jgi:tetratricopeptide (TPR) repeat protein
MRSFAGGLAAFVLFVLGASAAAAPRKAEQAEAIAARAAQKPAEAASLAEARRALAMTEDFDPSLFVKIGRKGEMVEDSYRQALTDYRSHRAHLYEAVGICLEGAGQARAAGRYLRRALLLDPESGNTLVLARALVRDGRASEALDLIGQRTSAALAGDRLVIASEAADVAGVASLQAEIDRARILKLGVLPKPEPRDGPVAFGDKLRLSTGGPFRLEEDGLTVLYAADPSCQSCSQDLEELKRLLGPELAAPSSKVRALVAPSDHEQDRALRQALHLYRVSWPMVLGTRAGAFGEDVPVAWVIGRRGFSAAAVHPPFARALPAVLDIFKKQDVNEPLPRAKWNGRAPSRRALATAPPLLKNGLAPGEDEPAPAAFTEAVRLFDAGRFAEARAAFEALGKDAEAWLLPAEARLNAAICIARQGDAVTARRLLRAIGDSRFQERVDQALETADR